MSIRRMLLPVLFFAAALLPAAASAQAPLAPDGSPLELTDVVGQGQWVMVNVWSPGCAHCLRELPALIRFHADNAAGATVLGLAVDYPGFGAVNPDALARFLVEHGVNFPNHPGDGASVGAFLGETIDLVPVTFAYDPDGRLVARWHGVVTERDLLEIINDFTPAAR